MTHPGRSILSVFVAAVLVIAGCRSTSTNLGDSYSPASEADRNQLEAQRLTSEAMALMQDDPARAESLLRRALAADPLHGPAHNHLGLIMLNASPPRLYEAAHEFEWAGRLMPGHPDPQDNLARTLEAVARSDEAPVRTKRP